MFKKEREAIRQLQNDLRELGITVKYSKYNGRDAQHGIELVGKRLVEIGATLETMSKGLDNLDDFKYSVIDWMKRVEGQLGVMEVTNNQGQKEFLSTKQKPVRGYINEDEGVNND